MIDFLHILIRVEDDGSLRALGAFSTKEKLTKYRDDAGLKPAEVRLDFHNGPFEHGMKVIYAGHRHWNMKRFQMGGYFTSEGEAWNSVTQDGYVRVLRIDADFAEEEKRDKEALELYAKLQKKWRLASYEEMVSKEGAEKAHANITLRFYEDALESFKPKTRRERRSLSALVLVVLMLPLAVLYYLSTGPEYGENLDSVEWLPETASNISFYRSKQINVFEFEISGRDFREWAKFQGIEVEHIKEPQVISRYKAYMPADTGPENLPTDGSPPEFDQESMEVWQGEISATAEIGLYARTPEGALLIYDPIKRKAYSEWLESF